MISSLTGTLTRKTPTEVVITVQGVGYSVLIPVSTFETLGAQGSQVLLHTHLHVREDALVLYGFATEQERTMFRILLSVNGIGPRMAQGILSGIAVADLKDHILSGNTGALTTIPGVGRKTAERLVVELREKLGKSDFVFSPATAHADSVSANRTEAAMALVSLGYNRQAAEHALAAAFMELAGESTPSLELLLKTALKHASRQ